MPEKNPAQLKVFFGESSLEQVTKDEDSYNKDTAETTRKPLDKNPGVNFIDISRLDLRTNIEGKISKDEEHYFSKAVMRIKKGNNVDSLGKFGKSPSGKDLLKKAEQLKAKIEKLRVENEEPLIDLYSSGVVNNSSYEASVAGSESTIKVNKLSNPESTTKSLSSDKKVNSHSNPSSQIPKEVFIPRSEITDNDSSKIKVLDEPEIDIGSSTRKLNLVLDHIASSNIFINGNLSININKNPESGKKLLEYGTFEFNEKLSLEKNLNRHAVYTDLVKSSNLKESKQHTLLNESDTKVKEFINIGDDLTAEHSASKFVESIFAISNSNYTQEDKFKLLEFVSDKHKDRKSKDNSESQKYFNDFKKIAEPELQRKTSDQWQNLIKDSKNRASEQSK